MSSPTEAKPHILFIDDEPMVLQGLRRMLHPMRNTWRIDFCEGGPEAVEKVSTEAIPYDGVVCDMRMPVMNVA